jgi:exosortase
VLLALWFVLCRQLSGEWSVNEQYSYGWFVPFFALFLFWLRWEGRPERESRKEKVEHAEPGCRRVDGTAARVAVSEWDRVNQSRKRAIAIGVAALLVLFPVRLFEVANPDWRPVDWIHASAVITITFVVLYLAGGWAWTKHFSFSVLFFFVAVPWISPIEQPIVQGLMRTVAAVATEALSLCGIPAQLEGSLIRVSSGLVGVNEACSGVRSLQTSLMIGLLFGELKRLSVGKRVALVLGAIAIAIVANFGRAFFLVWVAATRGISAVSEWHDFAGYTIVAVVFCGSLLLATILNRNKVESRKSKVESKMEPAGTEGHGQSQKGERAGASESKQRKRTTTFSTFYFPISFVWLFAVEIGVEAWYRIHERGLVAREHWSARWPEAAKDFREIHIDETTRRILRFDQGRGAMWRIPDSVSGDVVFAGPDAQRSAASALLYFFRWRAGSNSALLANSHRPDVCLPATGWRPIGDYGIHSYQVSPKLSLPFRHFVFAQGTPAAGVNANLFQQRFAHAFYCLREDRVRNESEQSPAQEQFAQEPSEWSRRERLNLVVQGRRHLGQQVMEFVLLTPQDVKPEKAEATFATMVPEMVEEK